jgi:hypothetical protein
MRHFPKADLFPLFNVSFIGFVLVAECSSESKEAKINCENKSHFIFFLLFYKTWPCLHILKARKEKQKKLLILKTKEI